MCKILALLASLRRLMTASASSIVSMKRETGAVGVGDNMEEALEAIGGIGLTGRALGNVEIGGFGLIGSGKVGTIGFGLATVGEGLLLLAGGRAPAGRGGGEVLGLVRGGGAEGGEDRGRG